MAMTREVGLGVKRFGASKSQLAKLSTSALAGNHTIADSSSYRKGDLEAWPATGKRKQQGEKTTMSVSTGGDTAAVATVHLPSPVQPTCGSAPYTHRCFCPEGFPRFCRETLAFRSGCRQRFGG